MTLLMLAAVLSVIWGLPRFLPAAVTRVRMWLFTRINGDEGIPVPGPKAGIDQFRALYGNPAASGRSYGAALSDLFWYWLAPGPEMHQEHLEAGPRYEAIAQTTRQILGLSKQEAGARAATSARRVLGETPFSNWEIVRLRDRLMPIWADFYYELIFAEPCPMKTRRLIVDNADDVIRALKLTRLRHMDRRLRLTDFLRHRIETGQVAHRLPEGFSSTELAYYLQGVFFNTAVVQMSEAMTHLLLVIAEHPNVQERLCAEPADNRYLDHVIAESLRLYPLFGIAHRITKAAISIPGHEQLPVGSVLCFNYPAFHREGFVATTTFDPDRWPVQKDANYIPFGVAGNRPCPAQAIALITMREVTREVLRRFALASSAAHTRSIPNRGAVLRWPRQKELGGWKKGLLLRWLRTSDRWEDVGRSILQLVLGLVMVLDARRQRLCQRHFGDDPKSRCPFAALRMNGR